MAPKKYYLHVAHDAPSNFHNQQFGRHHGFQIELELRKKSDNSLAEDVDLPVGFEVFYANPSGIGPPTEPVENQDIVMFLQRSSPNIKSGTATFKVRIKEVSKNHMKRKFQIKLKPKEKTAGMSVEPCYLNPIFVLSKVPRKYRAMYTEAAVCAAMEVDGNDEASALARRQMGMQSRGRPLDRVTAASVLAATRALGSDVPEIKHDLMTIAKQANAGAPKPKKSAAKKRALGGELSPAMLNWCFLCDRQIRQLEWMEVPGTMHVACPVCKASYLSTSPYAKRKHLDGCTMGNCINLMPPTLQAQLRRDQMQSFSSQGIPANYGTAPGGYTAYGGTAGGYYHGASQQQPQPQHEPEQGRRKRHRGTARSPTASTSTLNNLPMDSSFSASAGGSFSGLTGTAGMLQRNASFRLQNLQNLQSLSNGPKAGANGRGGMTQMGSFAATGLTGASAIAGQSMTQEQIISWMEDAMVKPGGSSRGSASSSSSSTAAAKNLPRLQSIGDLMRHQSMSDILGKASNIAKALKGNSNGTTGKHNQLSIPGVTMLKEEEVKV